MNVILNDCSLNTFPTTTKIARILDCIRKHQVAELTPYLPVAYGHSRDWADCTIVTIGRRDVSVWFAKTHAPTLSLICAYVLSAWKVSGQLKVVPSMKPPWLHLPFARHVRAEESPRFFDADEVLARLTLEKSIASASIGASPELLYMLASVYADQGRPTDAATVYRQVLQGDPRNVDALVELSEMERILGEQQAASHLCEAKTLAATDLSTLLHFGQVCMRRRMYVDAKDALKQVVAQEVRNRQAWYINSASRMRRMTSRLHLVLTHMTSGRGWDSVP